MAKWQEFERCPHCGLDFGTGEGDRACSWGDCAYLPEELNVFCDQCRFNFYTMEGNPPCPDPLGCEHSAGPLEHVENYRRWLASRQTAATAP
jgi:hypothetical protein